MKLALNQSFFFRIIQRVGRTFTLLPVPLTVIVRGMLGVRPGLSMSPAWQGIVREERSLHEFVSRLGWLNPA